MVLYIFKEQFSKSYCSHRYIFYVTHLTGQNCQAPPNRHGQQGSSRFTQMLYDLVSLNVFQPFLSYNTKMLQM